MECHTAWVVATIIVFMANASTILSPQTLNGTYVPSTIFLSGPQYPILNACVVQVTNEQACSLQRLQQINSSCQEQDDRILYVQGDVVCFPEVLAAIAHQLSFVGVARATHYRSLGFNSLSLWKSKNAPIPIFEVHENSLDEAIRVMLIADENPLTHSGWIGLVICFELLLAALAIHKLYITCRLIYYKKKFARSGAMRLNIVILLELIGSLLYLTIGIDFLGYLSILSYPMVTFLTNLNVLTGLMSTYLLTGLFQTARRLALQKRCSPTLTAFHLSFILLVGVLATLAISTSWFVIFPGVLALRMNVVLVACFQMVVGGYFIASKSKAISELMKGAQSIRGQQKKTRMNQVQSSAFYLGISGILMVFYVISIFIASVLYYFGLQTIYGLFFGNLWNILIGTAQISSLPSGSGSANDTRMKKPRLDRKRSSVSDFVLNRLTQDL